MPLNYNFFWPPIRNVHLKFTFMFTFDLTWKSTFILFLWNRNKRELCKKQRRSKNRRFVGKARASLRRRQHRRQSWTETKIISHKRKKKRSCLWNLPVKASTGVKQRASRAKVQEPDRFRTLGSSHPIDFSDSLKAVTKENQLCLNDWPWRKYI